MTSQVAQKMQWSLDGARVLTQLCPHCQGTLELAVGTYAPDSWAVQCGAHYLHPHAAPMALFVG